MKQTHPKVCMWGHGVKMLYYRTGIFLPPMGISREEVSSKTVPKSHPLSEHVKDLLLDTTVFENSYFRNSTTVLFSAMGPRSLCSYSGVLGFQFLRKSAGCYNLVWQVSLLSANFIVLVTICCPTPIQSPEEVPTGLCPFLRPSLFFQQSRKCYLSLSLKKKKSERLNFQRNPGTELKVDTTFQRHFLVWVLLSQLLGNTV